jgi:hypothetical protein
VKQVFFFATPDDIRPVLRRFKSHVSLKFVEIGRHVMSNLAVFLESLEIPNPGIATHETGSASGRTGPMQVRPPVVASVHEPLVHVCGLRDFLAFGAALEAREPL